MLASDKQTDLTARLLTQEFLLQYPQKSARHLENMSSVEAAALLQEQPVYVVRGLWRFLPAGIADAIFEHYGNESAAELLKQLDTHIAVALLSRIEEAHCQAALTALANHNSAMAHEFEELLKYPDDSAAKLMNTKIQVFQDDATVHEALQQLKQRHAKKIDVVYLLNPSQQLSGEVDLCSLIVADSHVLLSSLAKPIKTTLNALDAKETVIERFEGYRVGAIPVLDANQYLVGSISAVDVFQATKEDLVSDMQSMVGAGKEEKALSSSWVAVKNRLPWLQINLLTAFAASAVVGSFQGLIAEITALAILLPVAAGQSGNAGAQALAVTMRGLTLREISTRHWFKVMMKEMRAGFINGVAIAITCGLAVYWWSQSVGLSLVIALAMISSLVIACSSGALVPIVLKKFGLDPAQSSSIVLTTITDIAGFLSFLGIALLFVDMLPKG
ncbi:MAG: magnesium transporter [Hahellaceae bacterium]|nr:magnesium transporter [Hahellaceae bacterium]MCP5211585.1 magnesium transporter [Hahellaceae bacterium]